MLTRNAASFQTSTCVQHLDKHNPSSLTVQERKELRIVPLVHELLTPSNTVQTYTNISVTADIIEGWISHQNLHANFFSPILWLCFLLQHGNIHSCSSSTQVHHYEPNSFPLQTPHILYWYTSYAHYTKFYLTTFTNIFISVSCNVINNIKEVSAIVFPAKV